ncbi:Inositol-tetrakisphosphate 1-kinase [Blomia tropicalis]|nr:Inositol-tetrakisphosphate 1-kinase [Blomia tropicalis]
MVHAKRVGYWWSEKKSQKINVAELARHFMENGYEFTLIDLDSDLELQGPFDAIIHKLSDAMCKVDRDEVASRQVKSFEQYVKQHPEVIIIDSLDNVRKVLDRYRQYKIIENSELAIEDNVFTPTFVEMTSTDVVENLNKMKMANVKFPFETKMKTMANSFSFQMSIIFNESGLQDINPPCVAQTFINHNARLFKLFIIKDKYFVIERPSIKNFKPNYTYETVHFDSHDISKPYSSSALTELDEEDVMTLNMVEPNKKRLDRIVKVITKELGLFLLGIDVIIENETGRYAIIDMNSFPGYDGVDNFLELYCNIVIEEIEAAQRRMSTSSSNSTNSNQSCLEKRNQMDQNGGLEDISDISLNVINGDSTKNNDSQPNAVYSPNDFDSGIDTSDSCDERKNPKLELSVKKKQHFRIPNCSTSQASDKHQQQQ